MKDMVNNFCRENVAKLTFGDIGSEIAPNGYPSEEIALAFTPTTLAALERTFVTFGESVNGERAMESDSTSAQVHWEQSRSYSGMSDCSNDSEDDSNSMDWMAGGKRARKCDSSGGESSQMMGDSRPARRLPGPRPSCRDEEMTPEELERRRRRRERNKTAAAKCRQRRVDQTNDLLEITKGLEEESQKLEKEIKTLEQLKHQLEFVLEAHKPVCKADVNATSSNIFKTESQSNFQTLTPASRPTSLPIVTTTAPQVSSTITVPTSAASQFFFDFPSTTGLTPLADPLAFFGSLEGASPSMFLLSPSSLLAQ